MASTSKRKYKDDIAVRDFNIAWEEQFFFTNQNSSKPVCLICGASVAVPKKFNLERHFTQMHGAFNSKYPVGSKLRTDFISKKKQSLAGQQSFFHKRSDEMESMVRASYEISLLLAKKKKPYSDGEEVIKPSLSILAKQAGDEKISKMVDQIALSRNTVMRRIDDMATSVNEQITSGVGSCKYFSLALDESCDLTDNAQLSIFVRYVNHNFDVTEELLDLRQLCTTRGEDIFNEIKNVAEIKNLDWAKLDSICTDGAPAMTGKIKGAVALLENYLGREIFKFHCIIHQESLCAKDLDFSSVINPVVRCVNKIRARALNRRQFRSLFPDETEENGELLLHCDVRWLSKGSALDRFWNLRETVLKFLEDNNELPNECSLLKNEDWLWNLAFLTDIMGHLNNLNLRLQGKHCIFPTLFSHISSFVAKLVLFANDFEQERLTHFSRMQELSTKFNKTPKFDLFGNFINILRTSFDKRFSDFQKDKKNIELFVNPFSISFQEIKEYSAEIQTEIIDLQNHSVLKGKYKEIILTAASNQDYIEFWKFVPAADFPNLHDLALRYCCRFGSTYVCEQIFSIMNFIKNKYRSTLTDSHLKNLILLASSKISPDIDAILKNIQIQKPH